MRAAVVAGLGLLVLLGAVALYFYAPSETATGTAPPPSASPATVDYLEGSGALPSGLPFSEAVKVGDTLYLSGMIGVKPGTLELVPGGLEAEARQTLDNIRTVLETHGYGLEDLVKCTVMMEDIAEWGAFNEIYKEYFDGRFPARSAFGADGLALGARVEVECIAAASP